MLRGLTKRTKTFHLTAAGALIAAAALLDFYVTPAMSVLLVYLLPVLWVVWYVGRTAGYVACGISAALWLVDDIKAGQAVENPLVPYWNLAANLVLFLVVVFLISQLKAALEREEREKQARLRRELEIARQVQFRLLPRIPSLVGAVEYAVACQPARVVGGDFYDFIPLGNERIAFVVGDVSGKGLPAALLMASLLGMLRGLAPTHRGEPCALLEELNRMLLVTSDASQYATLFIGVFEGSTRTLRYANAGHIFPILLRRRSGIPPVEAPGNGLDGWLVERLTRGGPPIGLLQKAHYSAESFELEPGDVILLTTDGVQEAANSEGEEFGEQRLIEVIVANAHCAPAQLRDTTLAAVKRFQGEAEPSDDMTLMVAKWL